MGRVWSFSRGRMPDTIFVLIYVWEIAISREMFLTYVLLFQDQPDLGEILLSLNYLPTAGRLNVDVMKAKQLLQTDLVGGAGKYIT